MHRYIPGTEQAKVKNKKHPKIKHTHREREVGNMVRIEKREEQRGEEKE